jgi:hypothetical protein
MGFKVRGGALAVRQDLMWDAWADGVGMAEGGKMERKGRGKMAIGGA